MDTWTSSRLLIDPSISGASPSPVQGPSPFAGANGRTQREERARETQITEIFAVR